MRERADLTTHRARQIELCGKFAEKLVANPRFESWFPRTQEQRSGRNNAEAYKEFTARTDRLNNTPLVFFCRRLNGKAGKIYGLGDLMLRYVKKKTMSSQILVSSVKVPFMY